MSCFRGENEALLAKQEDGGGEFEVVAPPLSILAEPPVAVVDKVVDKHNTRALAEAYLQFLYTPVAQELAAKHFYRPRDPAVAARHAAAVSQDRHLYDRVIGRLVGRAKGPFCRWRDF